MQFEIQVEQVRAWAQEAGQIAMEHFNHAQVMFKADQTMVTQADRQIEAMLSGYVQAAYPGHALIGEEGARGGRADSDWVWAIDPIDGTRAFVQGLPCWGISIGVLYQGVPYFGLFYMPLLNDWTYTTADAVICNGRALIHSLRTEWDDQSFLAISSSTHNHYHIGVKRARALGTLAANMVYTARGTALGALLEHAAIWDVAAGAAVLGRLGAEFRYLSGRAVCWSGLLDGRPITEPLVTAHPCLLGRLLDSIRPR